MKNVALTFLLLLAAVALTACGGRAGGTREMQGDAVAAQSAASVGEAQLLSDDDVAVLAASQAEQVPKAVKEAAAEVTQTQQAENDRSVDLDLTALSGTVVYSQVYDMMTRPEAYLGQTIRIRGSFSYYRDPETHQEYFAAVIADATACCAQGIEFVWKGEHSYPRDYPPPDTEITVTGTFGAYYEGEYRYVQLADADVSW